MGTRAVTESLRATERIDGRITETPLLRTWVNLPALLLLFVGLYTVSIVVRDATRGRRRLPLAFSVAFLIGLGLARSFAFVGGHYPPMNVRTEGLSLGPGAMEATDWLRTHTSPAARIVTNAHCIRFGKAVDGCDSRHFWMGAFAERRFVLEGWAYTRFGEGWTGPFWGDSDFLNKNDQLFSHPTRSLIESLTAEHGARWMLVDLGQPHDLAAMRWIGRVDSTLCKWTIRDLPNWRLRQVTLASNATRGRPHGRPPAWALRASRRSWRRTQRSP